MEEEQVTEFNFVDWLATMAFPILIILSVVLAGTIGGVVKSGMFMGMVSTMALWFVVIKFPVKLKIFMSQHVLLFDLLLSILLFATFTSFIGPGPTVLMASVTQAVLLSILLTGLKAQYIEYNTTT